MDLMASRSPCGLCLLPALLISLPTARGVSSLPPISLCPSGSLTKGAESRGRGLGREGAGRGVGRARVWRGNSSQAMFTASYQTLIN